MENILKVIKTKRGMLLVFVFGLLMIVLMAVILIRSGKNSVDTNVGESLLVSVEKDGDLITIDTDGNYTLESKNGQIYNEVWSNEKINEFLDYLRLQSNNLSGNTTVTFGDGSAIKINDDELVSVVIEETVDNGPGSGGGGGDDNDGSDDDISDYFDNPGGTTTPTPTSGSGDLIAPPGCRLWKLSYCADPAVTPTPTPSSSGAYQGEVPYVFDCDLGSETVSSRTIISNTLCLVTPTPLPTL